MPLRIAISGSSGLIGTAVSDSLLQRGHTVTPIIRSSTPIKINRRVIRWKILSGEIDKDKLEGHDAVIHLAGVNIADRKWTEEFKQEIRESRVKSTTFLCNTLARLKQPPRVLLSTSAIGYYGHVPATERKDESSPRGMDFMADLCQEWEAATRPAQDGDIRVVHMRLGMVLSTRGGALAKMLPLFKLGLGGKLGSGNQMMSWIALDEIPAIVAHLLNNQKISGPVNLVSPNAVSNSEFTRVLGAVLHRPAILPVPEFAVKMMFGEMGELLLLNGANILPTKLLKSGYHFVYPGLQSALEHCLYKKSS